MIVLSMAVVKIALHFGWIGVPEATRDVLLESAKLVGGFIAPRTWTWWELGLVGDALLTFGLLYSADFVLSRIAARRKGYNTHKVADIFAAVTFVRAASALAIIGYFVWMAILSV